MPLDYNLLRVFVKVCELGSFTQAANTLNQPKSRVSRSIAKLERELGVELIRRTTRKISLTSLGESFYVKVVHHLSAINDEIINVSDKQVEMVGTIKVTASDSLAQTLLPRIISEYNLKYPKVRFEMLITNEYVDLVNENLDLAFRAGKLKDSTLIQKKFISVNFILVCASSYARKFENLNKIGDLNNCKYLSFKPLEKKMISKGVTIKPIVSTSSFPMILKMVLDGAGVAILPDFLCEQYLESKKLVKLIPSWKLKDENIHILYPPTKNQAKKVSEFIKIAKELYSK